MAQSGESSVADLFGILDDEYARDILVYTAAGPQSVEELSEACGASPSTIYRRIDRLVEHDLLESQQQLDPDGHHYKEYEARLDRISVVLTPDGFDVELDLTGEEPADRFTRLYEEFTG